MSNVAVLCKIYYVAFSMFKYSLNKKKFIDGQLALSKRLAINFLCNHSCFSLYDSMFDYLNE